MTAPLGTTAPRTTSRGELMGFVGGLAFALLAASAAIPIWLGGPATTTEDVAVAARAANVTVLPSAPDALEAPPAEPIVLLVGNSHTYALPGLQKGDELRPDIGASLIDQLATRVDAAGARYYRLSYPNFLSLEILTRVGQLLQAGYRPKVVVLAWSWSNVGRDRSVRTEVRDSYRDPRLASDLIARLTRKGVDAPPELVAAIEAEAQAARAGLEEERGRSVADLWETDVQRVARAHIPLFGRNTDVRARVYRDVLGSVQMKLNSARETSSPKAEASYMYDSVDAEMRFNRACMLALLRLLASEGIYVFTYASPERPDMPALVDRRHQQESWDEYRAASAALGFATVDARALITEPSVWGWAGNFPDRSHFTEPGHAMLAQFLSEQGTASGVWARLRAP